MRNTTRNPVDGGNLREHYFLLYCEFKFMIELF